MGKYKDNAIDSINQNQFYALRTPISKKNKFFYAIGCKFKIYFLVLS